MKRALGFATTLFRALPMPVCAQPLHLYRTALAPIRQACPSVTAANIDASNKAVSWNTDSKSPCNTIKPKVGTSLRSKAFTSLCPSVKSVSHFKVLAFNAGKVYKVLFSAAEYSKVSASLLDGSSEASCAASCSTRSHRGNSTNTVASDAMWSSSGTASGNALSADTAPVTFRGGTSPTESMAAVPVEDGSWEAAGSYHAEALLDSSADGITVTAELE